jgi:hypothetical protein
MDTVGSPILESVILGLAVFFLIILWPFGGENPSNEAQAPGEEEEHDLPLKEVA